MHVPLTTEFSFLSTTRNQAAIDCLSGLLDSSDSSVRWQAGLAISARSDERSREKFLEAFDSRRRPCRREWKTLGYRLVATIMRVLEDPRHPLYRAALKAIADCEIDEGLGKLVRVAEQVSQPHGAYAGKLLVQLAVHLGAEARRGAITSTIRGSLLNLLAVSLSEFSTHRSTSIAEAFLACVNAVDAEFAAIMNHGEEATVKVLTRQWKSTQRVEVLELLVSLLGKPFMPKSVSNILFHDRKDIKMALALARGTRDGLSPIALKRIHQNGIPQCCLHLNPNDTSLSEQDRWTLWLLIAAGKAPLPRLLEGVCCFLDNPSTDSQLAVANILRHYPSTDCSEFLEAMVPKAMPDENRRNSPSTATPLEIGSKFRCDIRKLLALLPNCDANLRRAIEGLFCEFNLETLMHHLDFLVDDAITCFAEILRSLHPDWPQALIPALESPNGERRCKAAIAASYLGPHPVLKAPLKNLLQDQFVMVQEEAAFALKDYPSPAIVTSFSLPISMNPKVGGGQ